MSGICWTYDVPEESDGSDKDCTPPNRTRSSIPSFSSHGIFGLSSTDVYSESSESSNDVEKEKIQTDQILVREVPVTAVILAAKSTFFLKMFTAGMSESLNKGSVSVHVTASGGLWAFSSSKNFSNFFFIRGGCVYGVAPFHLHWGDILSVFRVL